MAHHAFSLSEAESRMILTQLYQVAIVFKHLRILLQVVPVELIDAVGR